MNPQHHLLVCTLCKNASTLKSEHPQRCGEKLFRQLQITHQENPLLINLIIKPVKCMGVCDRGCAIALVGSDKFTYLFGDMSSADEKLESTTVAILDCTKQYISHSQGLLPYSERPKALQDTIIAKIPAFPTNNYESKNETDSII